MIGITSLLVLAFGPSSAVSTSCLETYTDGESLFPSDVQVSMASRGAFSGDPAIVEAASLVSISYGPHFKVLTETLSREQYVLVQCGAPAVTDADVDIVAPLLDGYERKRFTIPLEEVATESTVQLSFLEALGVTDRVRFTSKYAVGACWQKARECNGGYEGEWGNATLRGPQDAAVSAVLSDCTPPCEGEDPNVIHVSASQDMGPLHTAEHIKFLAAFFNKEAEANSIFAETAEDYNNLVRESVPSSPKVAWISKVTWPELGFTVSLATYKTMYVSDAGGRNVDEAEATAVAGSNLRVTDAVVGQPAAGRTLEIRVSDFAGGEAAAAAAFTAMLADVDVIIDETYAPVPGDYNMDSFLSEFGIDAQSTLPAIAGQKVFREDGTLSENGDLDWFESRLAHPQWVLQDLTRGLHGDGESFRYLRNMAAGETSHIVEVAHCTTQLPACGEVSTPADIPLLYATTDMSAAASQVPVVAAVVCFVGLQLS